jgi:alpha-L-arabinofuranosidase
MGWRIRSSDDVPYVDVAAARSDDGNRVAFAVNRDLRDAREVTVDIGSAADEVAVALLAGVDGDPFARRTRWDRVDGFEVTEWTATSDERGVSLSMPPGSVARLWLPVGGAET